MNEYPEKISNTKAWFVMILLAVTWGTSFILMKKALEAGFDPKQVSSIRVGISSLVFLPFLFKYWNSIDWKRTHIFLAIGLLGTLIPSFLFPLAQTKLDSSLTGILNSFGPISTLILGLAFFGKKLLNLQIVGVTIGLGGAFILISKGASNSDIKDMYYGVIVILATICYSVSSNVVEEYTKDIAPFKLTAISYGILFIPTIFFFYYSDAYYVITSAEDGLKGLGFIAVLALFSTVMASILFFYLIQRSSAVFASTIAYLVPIVATIWGVFDGESVTIFHVLGMVLILVGVYISRKSEKGTY